MGIPVKYTEVHRQHSQHKNIEANPDPKHAIHCKFSLYSCPEKFCLTAASCGVVQNFSGKLE